MDNTKPGIDAMFDGGSVLRVDASDTSNMRLKIRRDNQADYRQWFYFRTTHCAGKECHFSIENAGEASYPEAWADGAVFASVDRITWKLVPTAYDRGGLSFSITPESDILYVALHTPYSTERHLDLISTSLLHPSCSLYATTDTDSSRQVEILKAGRGLQDAPVVWIIARQHPAETMAEWFMEGLLERLLSKDEPVAQELLDRATFYLVPNMNPDGSAIGNFRTNASGIDLNRAWESPSLQASPEVHLVKSCMDSTGVDLFLDIHGDEEIRFVFAAGCEGIPGYSPRQANLDSQFRQAFKDANPEFSMDNGYPTERPGNADLSIACNQIGSRFGCLSLTIEIPFVDNQFLPNTDLGWSGERSRRLGASVLDPIRTLLDQLRQDASRKDSQV